MREPSVRNSRAAAADVGNGAGFRDGVGAGAGAGACDRLLASANSLSHHRTVM